MRIKIFENNEIRVEVGIEEVLMMRQKLLQFDINNNMNYSMNMY